MDLNCVRDKLREIEALEQKLTAWRTAATTAPTSPIDGLPRARPLTSRTENFAQKIIDGEQELKELRSELSTTTARLSDEIFQRVDDGRERNVLFLRYVAGLDFKKIAAQLSLTKDPMFKLHRRGREKFSRSEKPAKTCLSRATNTAH